MRSLVKWFVYSSVLSCNEVQKYNDAVVLDSRAGVGVLRSVSGVSSVVALTRPTQDYETSIVGG